MLELKRLNFTSVIFLSLDQLGFPFLVELLILGNVGSLALLSLLLVDEDQLFLLAVEFLLF